MMTNANENFWDDADLVYAYTREQALEDGVLVALPSDLPACQLYKHPIAVTAAVWALIDKAVKNPKHCNSLDGVVYDILYMSQVYRRMLDPSTALFKVIITGAGRQRNYTFKLVVGPADDGSPCITIMLPNED